MGKKHRFDAVKKEIKTEIIRKEMKVLIDKLTNVTLSFHN